MKVAVLVNGVPASGKSRVAEALAAATGWPLLTLDVVKEALFNQIGPGDREFNRKLGKASFEALFSLIRDFPANSTTIVDAWYGFQPREFTLPLIARAELAAAVELWCHAPPDVIVQRYSDRIDKRPKGHPGLEYVPELYKLAGRAGPLEAFPVIRVDTTAPLDAAALVSEIGKAVDRR